ncbi:hypothetical protein Y1Q_0021163 [Alligator mississippiensis]|uniref:Uncharacterized protein n=1 Tax=Alligator mississippiensis TaxID=8496 RepID=A0A151N088_ALLMI|nr:hypothetical protein Y1Q_0021163 [Alligator mississippiensis]
MDPAALCRGASRQRVRMLFPRGVTRREILGPEIHHKILSIKKQQMEGVWGCYTDYTNFPQTVSKKA